MNANASVRLLTYEQVRERIPFTRQWLSELERRGQFPKRVKIGPRRVAWREPEVDDWIATRARAEAA